MRHFLTLPTKMAVVMLQNPRSHADQWIRSCQLSGVTVHTS